MGVRRGLRSGMIAVVAVLTAGGGVVASAGLSAARVAAPGYWLLGNDGGVFSFAAPFLGSASGPTTCRPNTTDREMPTGTCGSIAATPDGGGYWILDTDTGVVHPYGDAGFFSDPATKFAGTPREFVPNFVAIVSTPDGKGYWVLERGLSGMGSVDPFGDATSYGDTVSLAHKTGSGFNGGPVALAATPDGKGYWEVHFDGGVFAFGDAGFYGSAVNVALRGPIVGIAVTADGRGYWLVASDGGVFAFGDAVFAGSLGGKVLAGPIVGIARNPAGPGYWLVASDGGVFAFGGAPFLGSMGGKALHAPVFAIAARAG